MKNFDLKKYLAEGRLIKEVMDEEMEDYVSAMYDSDVDQEAEEGFQSDVWSKAEYASNAYDESSIFLELIDHLKSVGGKDVVEGNPDIELELLPNGDIKWSANVTFTEGKTLNESAPGYDTRKQGEALPTLESVKAAYEAKNDIKEEDDYDTGGYVESMGPEFEKGINSLIDAWEEWKMGPMTEPGMVPYAKLDILKYLEMQLMEENL